MYKIRTYNTIAIEGLDQFPRDRYEVASEIAEPDGILLRSASLHELEFPKGLKAIARAGAGVNNVPVQRCTEQGIVVFNSPGANANAVKELVMAGLLLSSRGIYAGMNFAAGMANISSDEMGPMMEAQKKQFKGQELMGKTLGVIGLGAIGSNVANMALNMGMNVIGFDPAISVDAAWRLPSQVQKAENIQQLLGRSDYVTLHVPAIPATQNLLNKDTLATLKQGARVLNFARGSIVNSADMIEALDAGTVACYVTDFPEPGLINRTDVLAMPHIGASTSEAEANCAIMGAQQLVEFIEHGNIRNSVNFPNCELERTTAHRLCFANQNVPKVLSHVLNLLAEQNLNVVDMLNKSRDNIAYNILDLETAPSQAVLDAIADDEQVFHLRSI
ncbi:3-phosphoglycerate dehydrogenase family protein [Reinekea marinisedimentorum]|uniref:D-3-phosphoglycerate dehydrogenase n=1 Tax=Reinekea marinisedimentorum TaxID=230495 RepID=A0A4R3HUF2_9GAMM|nr:3-phosphoglycerate dehydrogenase family protein [Reinekea marinisedimentorum]TCS36732.1 D-3-phosphoglycerate dehydrogenase [Reinekea marinisedimentorum]